MPQRPLAHSVPMAIPPSTMGLTLRLLDTPIRVLDTRPDQPPNGLDLLTGTAGDGVFTRGEVRRIDVSYVLGATLTGVDSSSEGVLLNVAVLDTVGASGNLKVWAHGAEEPAISVLNWDHAGSKVANSITCRHFNGYVAVRLGGAIGCSAHVLVDVLGFHTLADGPPAI